MPKTRLQTKTKVEPTNNLGRLFCALRYAERKTLREVAEEIGTAPATVLRIEQGYIPDGVTTRKLLMWLFQEHEKNGNGI